jgi:hypothetical protein
LSLYEAWRYTKSPAIVRLELAERLRHYGAEVV